MASVAVGEAVVETPLSLYIDLVRGTRGDLEVISRAAIAWSELIRETAFFVDPFLEVRVELVSGSEGSIDLNSLIRAVRGAVADPQNLKAIAIAVLIHFAWQAEGWVVGKGYDDLWASLSAHLPSIQAQSIDDQERRNIDAILSKIADSKATRDKASAVFFELSKDKNVSGVGVSLVPNIRPPFVVPREEFGARSGVQDIEEELIARRTERDRLELTLLAPVLSEGDYKWKFQFGSKTLWALMDDATFKARLEPGSNSAPRMITGIRMDVDLATVQELKNGAWTTVSQTITKVHGIVEPVKQPSWLGAPSEQK